MSDCCKENDSSIKKEDVNQTLVNEEPKSFIGKFLYRLGKRDLEQNKNKANNCC